MYLPNWLVDYEQGIIKDRSTVIEEVKDENYSIDLEKYVYFNNFSILNIMIFHIILENV